MRTVWILATMSTLAAQPGMAQVSPQDTAQAGPTAEQPKKLNPYTGDEEKIAEGRKLYLRWNCYGCHGSQGGGGMGPALNDEEWRYGGDDANVLETIQKGRQGGMPTFECRAPATAGQALKDDGIWKMIAYVRAYYKGDPSKVLW